MKRFLALVAGLMTATLAAGQPAGPKAGLPADLAAVPNDAFAFAHVKLADVWKNDALKDVRDVLRKAGPMALEAFDRRFTPAPSTVERITAYKPPPNFEAGGGDFDVVFILSVGQPFDRDKFVRQLGKT
jgi:hypothetical protein